MSASGLCDKRYVFVGGAHKSGTSLVYKTLATSDDASKLDDTGVPEDEGQWLQGVYLQDVYCGELLFGLSESSYLDERAAPFPDHLSAALLRSWAPYWNLQKSILIEKSPINIVRTRYLNRLFPNSHFVVTIRNPRTTFMAARKTNPHISPETYFENWIRMYSTFLSDANTLASSALIAFESLVSEPQTIRASLERQCALRNLKMPTISNDRCNQYLLEWEKKVPKASQVTCDQMLPDWTRKLKYKLGLHD